MEMYILVLFIIYLSFNVFTDIRQRITKNYWHLCFLILGSLSSYFFGTRNMEEVFVVMISALICGLVCELFKFSSPGDTKMLIVSSMYLIHFVQGQAITVAITFTVFHILFFTIASIYRLIKILGFKGAFKDQLQHAINISGIKVPTKNIELIKSFPGACSIMLSAIVYIAISFL